MNKIYYYSFQIYRAILILLLPLLFFGKLMAGFGGHNPPLKTTDYIGAFFILCTAVLLISFSRIEENKIRLKNAIRVILASLIAFSILFLLSELYDEYQNYTADDPVPLAIIIFLTTLSSLFMTGLIRNEI